MLNLTLLPAMSDERLLSEIAGQRPGLLTNLEQELAKRFAATLDLAGDARDIMEAVRSFTPQPTADDIEAIGRAAPASWAECAAMLAHLNERDIYDLKSLKEALK